MSWNNKTKESLSRAAQQFAQDRKGSIAITFALMLTASVALIGGSVDYGRWASAKSKTLNAMDTAVLAGGRILQLAGKTDADAVAAASQYYARNKSNSLKLDNTTFKVEGNQVVATTNSTVDTPFLNVVGIDSLPIKLTSKAELAAGGNAGSHIEVAMMLDTTGSMSGSKMTDLKAAAKDLVEIVIWQDQSEYTSRVGLAPFSYYVNVGSQFFNSVAGPDAGKYVIGKTEDVDVEVEREVCEKKTKVVYYQKWNNKKKKWVTKKKKQKYTECSIQTVTETQQQQTTENVNLTDFGDKFTCIKERNTSSRYLDDAPAGNNYFDYYGQPKNIDGDGVLDEDELGDNSEVENVINNGSACRPTVTLTPLTSDKTLLKTRIDAMPTTGMTAGHLGTQWAWYLVSPKWKDVWPAASEPKAYSMTGETNSKGKPKLYKIAVLMTDGSYNQKYTGSDSKTQAREICKEMKKTGVTVYSVGFKISQGSSPDETMKQCATSSEHYYNAATGDALKQAFRDIALKIADLRISE